ncbi:MAG: hypothetical protein ABIV51_08495 [Saprospiraceae bacterium]
MKKKALIATVLAIAVLSISKKNRDKFIALAKDIIPNQFSQWTERFMPSK